MKLQQAKRECNGCELCCELIRVNEIQKEAGICCKFLSIVGGLGCVLHGSVTMPVECSKFSCEWLRGNLPLSCWPKSVGAIGVQTADGIKVVGNIKLGIEMVEYWTKKFERKTSHEV